MSDIQKLRKKISYLKELETIEAVKAEKADKKNYKKENQKRNNFESIIAITDEKNRILSDVAAKFSEKYSKSHK